MRTFYHNVGSGYCLLRSEAGSALSVFADADNACKKPDRCSTLVWQCFRGELRCPRLYSNAIPRDAAVFGQRGKRGGVCNGSPFLRAMEAE